MSALSDRIRTILREQNIRQVDFARSLGVSANYVNLLVNGKKDTLSETLALLIQELYGYPAQWILNGRQDIPRRDTLTIRQRETIERIRSLDDRETQAVLAFVRYLQENGR